MCGIAGIFNFNNNQTNQLDNVVKMTNRMSKRGPDDEGFVIVDIDSNIQQFYGNDTPENVKNHLNLINKYNNNINSILCLGHRRLSIIDLSATGHQPMIDNTSRYVIVFNGEIYNYLDIKRKLQSNGINFSSSSDTEVILKSYIYWGSECLKMFNGDFAFAIWDNLEKSIFCARDRLGIKPFYYILNDNNFIFASDIKSLIASGLYKPEANPTGLYLSMAFGIAPRPITAFKNIYSLKQSSYLKIYNNGKSKISEYWNIPLDIQNNNLSEQDALDLVEEKLTNSIKLRLVSDVPIGTLMSGGVDSSLMTAIASKNHSGIKAFTLGFEKNAKELDEVKEATDTALLYPIKHIINRVNPEDSIVDLIEWIEGYEEPFYSISVTHVISKIINQNDIKVVLNGLGGDELFSGYSYYKYHNFPNLTWASNIINSLNKYFPNSSKLNLLNSLSQSSPDRIHTALFMQNSDDNLQKIFNKNFIEKINTPDLVHDLYAKNLKFCDKMQAMNYMDLMNYVGNHFVHRIDQFSMAFSLEGRFPYLDHELIEASFTIPGKYKIKNNEQKYILRRVAEKYISNSSLKMSKKGFGLPLELWMKGPLKNLVLDSLNKLKGRDIIRPEIISEWYNLYCNDKINATKIWHLVSLELWHQKFID